LADLWLKKSIMAEL